VYVFESGGLCEKNGESKEFEELWGQKARQLKEPRHNDFHARGGTRVGGERILKPEINKDRLRAGMDADGCYRLVENPSWAEGGTGRAKKKRQFDSKKGTR